MGIALDEPSTGGPPAPRLNNVGDQVVVGIVNVEQVQARDFDSGDPLTWDDGNPKMYPRITGLVVSVEGATVGEDDRPIEVGELVTIHAQGGRVFPYRDAVREHGTVQVGDVMLWRFDSEEPPKKRGFNPRKVIACQIRSPEGRDGDLLERCEAAHLDRRERTPVDSTPAAVAEPAPASTPF